MCKHLGWEETLALLFFFLSLLFCRHKIPGNKRKGKRARGTRAHRTTQGGGGSIQTRAQDNAGRKKTEGKEIGNAGREQNEWERRKI